MFDAAQRNVDIGHRYALCIGIGKYSFLKNKNLRFATSDASAISSVLKDPQRGNFDVKLLTDPTETTKGAIEDALDQLLNGADCAAEDLVIIYISCHGSIYGKNNIFYLLPSDARQGEDNLPQKTTIIDIHDLAKTLSGAKVKNIIFLLDACYSGGASHVLQKIQLDLEPDTNLFIIGGARQDQTAIQSSKNAMSIFTSYLLQAFEQKPKRNDGWITISDIQSFISDKVEHINDISSLQIQGASVSDNYNLPIIKNPLYSPQNIEFYEQVKTLMEIMRYEPILHERLQAEPPGFYVASFKMEPLPPRKIGIIPYNNQIESLKIDDLNAIIVFIRSNFEQRNLDHGIIVTKAEVSNNIKQIISENVNIISYLTYQNISQSLINFGEYLNLLIHKFENPKKDDEGISLSQTYIPLRAERRLYDLTSPQTTIQKKQ